MRAALLAGLCGALVAGLSGCGRAPRPASFVVVVVDTLRLDRLHFASPVAKPTPGFDRLRDESTWFSRAYASSSWTLPSVASLLLSQLPSEHRVASWGSRLSSEQATLPDVLRSAGYRTAMFTANRIIAGERGFVGRFDAGELIEDPAFDGSMDAESAFADAEAVSLAGLAWLDAVREDAHAPYLALLHYMDPHAPYPCAPDAAPDCAATARALSRRLLALDWELAEQERARVSAYYEAGVARMDAALAALLGELERRGVLDEAWLVLLADHGELLGEDGLYLHGRSLVEPLVRVPLLFRRPGGGARATQATPVSLLDVAPTLLELAGRPAPPAFRGRSFAAALAGAGLAPRPVAIELPQVRPVPDPRSRHVFALVDGDEKLLLGVDGSVARAQLGPGDVGGAEQTAPATRAELDARLDAAGLVLDPADYSGGDLEPPSQEMLDALRRLGYVE